MSAYQVRLGPTAAKAFAGLEPAHRNRIRKALEKLARDVSTPGRVAGKTVKSIRGTHDDFHRLRVGHHRVMYDVIHEDRVILVLGIVHRSDLERWLRRR